ncbi:MAG: hypothetical protein GIW97_08415 [Candidatus Eremiobacteraeota bacterium]|nr:hypothetical protein [Candidatus Eremiobacteraeota bacterium]
MMHFVFAVVVLTSPKPTLPPMQPWRQTPVQVCFAKKNPPCNTAPVKIQFAHSETKAKKASPKH